MMTGKTDVGVLQRENHDLRQQLDALAADNADNVRRMADDANKLHAAWMRVAELEADNAEVRRHRDEVCSTEIALKDRIHALAAELALAHEGRWPDVANVLNGYVARIAELEAALTLLTDGWKYSTDVITIAREALEQK
jgi:hypothetical protein